MPTYSNAIEAVFIRLVMLYGTRWQNSLGGVAIEQVKAMWARELAGMPDWAVRHGLNNMPASFPPTVLEFKALCQGATAPQERRLAAPSGTGCPAPVRGRLRALVGSLTHGPRDPVGWAKQLQARHERGDKLTRFQIECYRRALRLGTPQ